MTIFIIIVSIFTALAFFILLGLLTKFIYNKWGVEKEEDNFRVRLTWKTIYILIIALFLICISFIVPIILTQESITKSFDFSQTGQIGDTIGGLMNPFIALAGVLVTGLAFYMQYKANILQRKIFYKQLEEDKIRFTSEISNSVAQFDKQFKAQEKQIKLQQFEAQFYEMLRLHKENVNEIELFSKRKVPYTINSEVKNNYETFSITKRNAFVELKKEFEFILTQFTKNNLGKIDNKIFTKCYDIFFWGISGFDNDELSLAERLEKVEEKTLENILLKFKNKQYSKESIPFEEEVNFGILAFEGHSEFLGHYYRHLFHTVKFVAFQEETFLTYEEKIKYLRVLRAQLSNHEQIMIFYNWLSGYGRHWEDDKNRFFTEYCMIHNLWYSELFKDNFISENVDLLRNKDVILRKNKMFEMD